MLSHSPSEIALFAVLYPIYPLFYDQGWFVPPVPHSQPPVKLSEYVQQKKRACVSVIAGRCQSYIVVSDVDDPLEGYAQLLSCITEDIARYVVYKSCVYSDTKQMWWRYTLIHRDDFAAMMQHMHAERLCLHHLMDKWHYLFSTLHNAGSQPNQGWCFAAWQGQLHQFLVIDAHIVVQLSHENPSTEMIIQLYKEAPIPILSWTIGPVDLFREAIILAARSVGAVCHEGELSVQGAHGKQSAWAISYRHRYRMCCYGLLLSAVLGVAIVWLVMSIECYRNDTQSSPPALSVTTLANMTQAIKKLPHTMPTQTMLQALTFTEKQWQLTAAYRSVQQAKVMADRLGPTWRCHRRSARSQIICSRRYNDH